MERYRQIRYEMASLMNESLTLDQKLLGYRISFTIKLRSLETMYRNTLNKSKELEDVSKTEEGEILKTKTTNVWYEAIAFFEAYLNAFYSLLQIIAKFTPYFYPKEKSELIKKSLGFEDNFGKLVNFLREESNVDPDFSAYLRTRLGWYNILRNNRHMITHEASAFLGFGQDGKIVFLDYPKKGFSWFNTDKSTRDLGDYLKKSFRCLFGFLDFYVNHFRKVLKGLEKEELEEGNLKGLRLFS